jgi:hypothetical protein
MSYLIKIHVAVERGGDCGIRGIVKVSENPHKFCVDWIFFICVRNCFKCQIVSDFKTESSEMWCCRMMDKIKVPIEWKMRKYYIVNEKRNILRTIKGRWLTGLGTSCLLKLIIEGQIERKIKWKEDKE